MRTPAQIAGHPIHPMLVPIPIGLWLFSLVADLIAMRSASPDTWNAAAFYTMIGGIIGALAAALPGLIDLLSLGDRPVKKTALTHMGLNLTIVALFAINAWMRSRGSASHGTLLGLSVIGVAMLVVSGWLGGKMVYEAGVGVHVEEATANESTAAWGASDGSRRATSSTGTGFGMGRERAMANESAMPGRDERSVSGRDERIVSGRDVPRE